MHMLINRRKNMSEQKNGEQLGLADVWLQKLSSRKLMVWITSTALMGMGTLESADWVVLSALYIGGQSVIDAVARFRGQ